MLQGMGLVPLAAVSTPSVFLALAAAACLLPSVALPVPSISLSPAASVPSGRLSSLLARQRRQHSFASPVQRRLSVQHSWSPISSLSLLCCKSTGAWQLVRHQKEFQRLYSRIRAQMSSDEEGSKSLDQKPTSLEELVKRIENGGLDDMITEGTVSTMDVNSTPNVTAVLQATHAECVMELMQERLMSEKYESGEKCSFEEGTTYQMHKWEQYADSFALYVSLPRETRASDLNVSISELRLEIHDARTNTNLVKGTFRYPIRPDGCNWCVEFGQDKMLVINLVSMGIILNANCFEVA